MSHNYRYLATTALSLACTLSVGGAQGEEHYLNQLDDEAAKVTAANVAQQNAQRRKLMLSAPSASAHVRSTTAFLNTAPRAKTLSLQGLSEVLRYRANASFELFQQLAPLDQQDVLDAYNAGANLDDLRPMIASLFQ